MDCLQARTGASRPRADGFRRRFADLCPLCLYRKGISCPQADEAPLWAAIASFVINVFLCLFLMEEYGVIGLAWANVGAAFVQLVCLLFQFKEVPLWFYIKPSPFFALGCILSSLVMGAALFPEVIAWTRRIRGLVISGHCAF